MLLGEAWRLAFNDRARQVRQHYKEQSVNLEVWEGLFVIILAVTSAQEDRYF